MPIRKCRQILRLSRRAAALLVVWALAGVCFADSTPEPDFNALRESSLTVWQAIARGDEKVDDMLGVFQQRTGIIARSLPVTADNLLMQYAYAQASGTLPDIIIYPEDQVVTLRDLNLPQLPRAWLDELRDIREGGRVAEVFAGHYLLMYYNRAEYPSAPTDWQQIIDRHARTGRPQVAVISPVIYFSNPFWYANGTFNGIGGWQRTDIDGVYAGIDAYKRLWTSGVIDPRCAGGGCLADLFLNGRLPIAIGEARGLEAVAASLGPDMGVAPLPALNGKPMKSLRIPYVLSIAKPLDGTRLNSTRALIEFLQGDEGQSLIAQITRIKPDHQADADHAQLGNIFDDVLQNGTYTASDLGALSAIFTTLGPDFNAFLTSNQGIDAFRNATIEQLIAAGDADDE